MQVCYDLSDPVTFNREIKALKTAMKELSIRRSLILSYNERREITDLNGVIRIVPVAEWLVDEEMGGWGERKLLANEN